MPVNEITNAAAPINAPNTASQGSITGAFRNLPRSEHPALRNVPADRQVAPVENLASQLAGPTPRR